MFGNVQPGIQSGNPSYNPLRNYAGFKSDQWSKLAYAVATETDPAKQKQIYEQWDDYALDQSWIMPVSANLPRTVMSPQVRGLAYNMAELLDATRTFLVS